MTLAQSSFGETLHFSHLLRAIIDFLLYTLSPLKSKIASQCFKFPTPAFQVLKVLLVAVEGNSGNEFQGLILSSQYDSQQVLNSRPSPHLLEAPTVCRMKDWQLLPQRQLSCFYIMWSSQGMFINIYEEIYRVVHLFFNKKDAERGHVPQFRKVYLKLNASGLQKWRFYLAPVIFLGDKGLCEHTFPQGC